MADYILKNAIQNDVNEVYGLIKHRIKWMDKNSINQWNKTSYLDSYPMEYFEGKAAINQLYVMKDEIFGKIAGAIVLLEKDKRWVADGSKSYYIHNLVSDPDIPGIGERIIHLCEKMAINNGKDQLRLDCQASNHKLNEYYSKLGFTYVQNVQEGCYVGNKREKKLK